MVAARTASRPPIQLSVKQVQRHLGTTIDPEGITREIVAQLPPALGCALTSNPGLDTYLRPSSPAGVSTSSARSTSSKR